LWWVGEKRHVNKNLVLNDGELAAVAGHDLKLTNSLGLFAFGHFRLLLRSRDGFVALLTGIFPPFAVASKHHFHPVVRGQRYWMNHLGFVADSVASMRARSW
jgi:hypothetical protein